jgi:tetratricopeptide (TPR) repeat protein
MPEAHNMRGLVCAKPARHRDSIVAFKEVYRLKPDFPLVQLNLAAQYRATGQLNDALSLVEKAIDSKKSLADGYRLKAEILGSMGRNSEAIESAQQAVMLAPSSGEMYFALGSAMYEAGHPDRALAYAQIAVELDSKLTKGHALACKAHNELGSYSDALKTCANALARDANNAEALFYRAMAYDKLDQINNATTDYRKAAEVLGQASEPDASEWHLWANIDYRLGRLERAVAKYKKALQLQPNLARAHESIGIAYLRLGRREAAIEELEFLKKIDTVRAARLRTLLDPNNSGPSSEGKAVPPFQSKGVVEQGEDARTKLVVEIAELRAAVVANQVKTGIATAERMQLRASQSSQRLQLQDRAESIVRQITTYESQVESELEQAGRDDVAAQRSHDLWSANSVQSDNLAALSAATNMAGYLMSKQSADKHRQRAEELLSEIDRLSHELFSITRPE